MLTASKSFPQKTMITDPTVNQTFTVQYDIFTVGAGYLNLDAALASSVTLPAGVHVCFSGGNACCVDSESFYAGISRERCGSICGLGFERGVGKLGGLGFIRCVGFVGVERKFGGLGFLGCLGVERGLGFGSTTSGTSAVWGSNAGFRDVRCLGVAPGSVGFVGGMG